MTNTLTTEQSTDLLNTLRLRFEKNMNRHPHISWPKVQERLLLFPEKLISLFSMEQTGGEPDVIAPEQDTVACIFVDCSAESPAGRRSLCYDREALLSRKANQPQNSITDMAAEMGIELLTEEMYRQLQLLGDFDLKTSSWLLTPAHIRDLGGAIFGDKRYGQVFVYHNGAESYYEARGFRAMLTV